MHVVTFIDPIYSEDCYVVGVFSDENAANQAVLQAIANDCEIYHNHPRRHQQMKRYYSVERMQMNEARLQPT